MAEYIEREEAMFRLSKWLEKASDTNNRGLYNFGEIAAYQTSIFEINSIPAADVRPVVRGQWERKPDPYGIFDDIPVCSNCGNTTKWRETYLFCPNCGADLRGVADDGGE